MDKETRTGQAWFRHRASLLFATGPYEGQGSYRCHTLVKVDLDGTRKSHAAMMPKVPKLLHRVDFPLRSGHGSDSRQLLPV